MESDSTTRLSEVCGSQLYGRKEQMQILQDALRFVQGPASRPVLGESSAALLTVAEEEKDEKLLLSEETKTKEEAESPRDNQQPHRTQTGFVSDRFTLTESSEQKTNDATTNLAPVAHQKFVFVAGKSGAGKSAIVEQAFCRGAVGSVGGVPKCLFGKGKFEQARTDARPFAALVACLSELCEALVDVQRAEQTTLYTQLLRDGLDPQSMTTLTNFIPNLVDVMKACPPPDSRTTTMSLNPTASASTKENSESLKYALRTFLTLISRRERPVVFCLDDIQWIDVSSLKLLEALMKNSALHHFLFVGIYREDEVGEDHPVSVWRESLPPCTQELSVGGLSMAAVVEMLQDAFHAHAVHHQDDPLQRAIRELAGLLHTRSDGNAFYVLQLLDNLQAEQLVTYSLSNFQWTWNIEIIKDRTSLADDLVVIVTARLRRLPLPSRETLVICSLLGFRFDRMTLETVMKGGVVNYFSVTADDLPSCLEELLSEGILEQAKGRIKFAHDKVYQAVSELQPENTDKLHLQVGKAIYKAHIHETNQAELDDRLLFLCLDQMNLARHLVGVTEYRVGLANLNLTACQRAVQFSAFLRASQHVDIALQLLDKESRWQDHHELCVELFTFKAELNYILGNHEEIEKAVSEVFQHARKTEEKVRVVAAGLQESFAKYRFKDSIDQALGLLSELGLFMQTDLTERSLEKRYKAMVSVLQRKTDESILSLPKLTNKDMQGAMIILDVLWAPMSQINEFAVALIAISMVEITLNYGLCPYAPIGLSRLAAYAGTRKNRDLAQRVQGLSSTLAKRPEILIQGVLARVRSMETMVFSWTKSLSQLTDNALEAYAAAMRSGDINTAMISIVQYASLYFYSGLPLFPIMSDLHNFTSVMLDYQQDSWLLMVLPFHECFSNLLGQSRNMLLLDQGLLREHRGTCAWNGVTGIETEDSLLMQIAFYCDEVDFAAPIATRLVEAGAGLMTGMWTDQARTFFFCLIDLRLSKAGPRHRLRAAVRRRRHLRDAKHHYEKLKSWIAEMGSVNSAHKLLILDAEFLANENNTKLDVRKAAYDRAIAASTRVGFFQDAALAAHLAMHAIPEEADMYWERASASYLKWGAKGVVDYIETKYHKRSSSSLDFSERRKQSQSFRARERFDRSLVLGHSNMDIDVMDG